MRTGLDDVDPGGHIELACAGKFCNASEPHSCHDVHRQSISSSQRFSPELPILAVPARSICTASPSSLETVNPFIPLADCWLSLLVLAVRPQHQFQTNLISSGEQSRPAQRRRP